MNSNFSNNLCLLRKQKGVSQKQVANDLQISQALLSHYEKGIRECGLDFVVKVCEYYNVSSDFLLGVTVKETSAKISKDILAEEKFILSTIDIIFVILKNINSKKLLSQITNYLATAVYTILRFITKSEDLYKVDEYIYSSLASSHMTMDKAKIKMILKEENLQEKLPKIHGSQEGRKYNDLKALVEVAEKQMKEEE